jgi:hypothetical protein
MQRDRTRLLLVERDTAQTASDTREAECRDLRRHA